MTDTTPVAVGFAALILLSGCAGIATQNETPTATPTATETPNQLDSDTVERSVINHTGVSNVSVEQTSDGYRATISPGQRTNHGLIIYDVVNASLSLSGELGTLHFAIVPNVDEIGKTDYCVNETVRADIQKHPKQYENRVLDVSETAITPEWCA